jgi:hypothetical protein
VTAPRSSRRLLQAALAAAFLVAAAPAALAEDGAVDPAAAEALFKEARVLSDAGKLDEACPKYEASYKLDPAPGTLLNLASCSERQGKTATAWSQYVETARVFRRRGDERRALFADGQAAKLEPSLAYATVRAAALAEGETLRRDGVELSAAGLGAKLPIDPGEHTIVASAPGRKSATVTFTAVAKRTVDVAVPELEVAPAAADGGGAATGRGDAGGARPGLDSGSGRGDTQRIAAYVTGGVGGASLVVGAIFVGLTADAKGSLDDLCPGGVCRTQDAKDTLSRAGTFANVANGTLIGGVVVLGVAAVVFFTAPNDESPDISSSPLAPRAVCGPAGCGVGWTF